jgi:hypothetical protein
MGKGHRIDANYTEEVVGFALEAYLTLLSFPRQRFSIEPFSRSKERWIGADGRLHGSIKRFTPFYMQFKRPFAYPDYSVSKIISGRKVEKLNTSPLSLYFPLRQKQPSHNHFQHNVLFRLNRRLRKYGLGDAAYVCPLFLDRSAYRSNLHIAGLFQWARFWHYYPYNLESVMIENGGNKIRFDRVPVLTEHISVPPHEVVKTASHSYSFNENGTELCFHSPASLPEGSSDFASFLSGISEGFLDGETGLPPDGSAQLLKELMSDVLGDQEAPLLMPYADGSDPIGRWFAWGDYLRAEYAINQFAMVRWEE